MPSRLLILNLPYRRPVIRKYQCSYYAPGFLMPPIELAYWASCVSGWGTADVVLVDAVGEGMGEQAALAAAQEAKPDVLAALAGSGTFPDDMRCLGWACRC